MSDISSNSSGLCTPEFEDSDSNASSLSLLPDDDDLKMKDPRVCFISLFYLFKQWTDIPFSVLYDSIIILYCRREWLFEFDTLTSADIMTDQSNILTIIQSLEITHSKDFLTFLSNKEKQGRLLFIDPNDVNTGNGTDKRWYQISEFLTQINSPITENKFEKIITNMDWWKSKFKQQLKLVSHKVDRTAPNDVWDIISPIQYCSHAREVDCELKSMSWKWMVSSEILVQSNPTLIPMAGFNADVFAKKTHIFETALADKPQPKDVSMAMANSWNMKSSLLLQKKDGMVYLK